VICIGTNVNNLVVIYVDFQSTKGFANSAKAVMGFCAHIVI